MINLRSLWSSDINEIEKFLNYEIAQSIKNYLATKVIKVTTHSINEILDEDTIVICYVEPENQCFKYNKKITIRLKGENKLFPIWEYKGNSYIKFSSLEGLND